ncbi:MAG: AAA family ATPase [Sphingomonas sp.]
MNEMSPRKTRGTLLERAAEIYDFGEQFRARRGMPVEPTQPIDDDQPIQAAVEEAAPPPKPGRAPKFRGERDVLDNAEAAAVQRPTAARIDRETVQIDRELLAAQGYLVPDAAVSVLAEEFRLVKRQLLLTARAIADAGRTRSRLVLVCSAKPGEGKTFCSINLALSLAAERDVEVLLADADFAKPDVMASLGLEERPGLLDALADPAVDLESCILATDIPKLALLPAGTKRNNDTELLASERTDALLAGLVEADPRRIVIFDSPPALAASPAAVLASQVGQVMMVVRADSTSETDLRQAVQLLDGCEHIQLVLNAVSFTPGGARFGTYYGQESAR